MPRRLAAWLGGLTCAAGVWGAIAATAPPGPLIFLSTQLRPIAEAQKMRNLILADFPREVDYITEEPQQFAESVAAEGQGGPRTIDVVGGLHGDLHPLAAQGVLAPLDDLAHRLERLGIPNSLLTLCKFGTAQQLAMPWMQASYILVANKKALPYLPREADIGALSYDQLAAWAGALQAKTGRRLLGFPAGPQGLMHRFFEGFLYPSYTGGVVVPFRSTAAEAMWTRFAALWKSVDPNSTGYNFMRQPLLSGDVWIGWDHVARLLAALRQKPDEFVAFPAPSGPKGRGYMPVLAGLAVPRDASDMKGAAALIDYLSQPQTQIVTARAVGFFPVVKATLPPDLGPAVKLAAAAIARMHSAKDALAALPPSGLGRRGGEFDRVFMDMFQRVVLHGEPSRAALDAGAETLNRLISETGAVCWQPDPPSTGACRVQ